MHHSLISSVRQQCKAHNVPIISHSTAQYIHNLLYKSESRYHVEIGSAQGYSTLISAEALRPHWATIHTFEISYPQYKYALQHYAQYGYHKIIAHYADATTYDRSRLLARPIESLFIDAQKSKYGTLLASLRPHIADDGLIIIDDVLKFKSKTTGLYQWLDENQIQYTIEHTDHDDGIMIITKKH